MKVALYARVSTRDKDQNPEMQLDSLRKYCDQEGWDIYGEYVDKASALDIPGRKRWAQLMKDAALRKFDEVLVWKLDRAFRDVGHSVSTMKLFEVYGIGFRSITDLPIDIAGPWGEFYRVIRVAFAQLERAATIEKIRAGISYAQEHGTKSGKPIGRPAVGITFPEIASSLKETAPGEGEINWSAAARVLSEKTGISASPGFLYLRFKRQAEMEGKTQEELLAGVLRDVIKSRDISEKRAGMDR